MCGIVGIFSYGTNIADLQQPVRQAVDMMARRGPDDEGIWSDGRVCVLGFRRLAILDLARRSSTDALKRWALRSGL